MPKTTLFSGKQTLHLSENKLIVLEGNRDLVQIFTYIRTSKEESWHRETQASLKVCPVEPSMVLHLSNFDLAQSCLINDWRLLIKNDGALIYTDEPELALVYSSSSYNKSAIKNELAVLAALPYLSNVSYFAELDLQAICSNLFHIFISDLVRLPGMTPDRLTLLRDNRCCLAILKEKGFTIEQIGLMPIGHLMALLAIGDGLKDTLGFVTIDQVMTPQAPLSIYQSLIPKFRGQHIERVLSEAFTQRLRNLPGMTQAKLDALVEYYPVVQVFYNNHMASFADFGRINENQLIRVLRDYDKGAKDAIAIFGFKTIMGIPTDTRNNTNSFFQDCFGRNLFDFADSENLCRGLN